MRYVLLIVVIGLGASLYAAFGRADVGADDTQPTATSEQKVASVDQLLVGLKARLNENPDDGKGWMLLAKSYDHLGRHDEAIAAYEKASALGVTDEQLLFRLMSTTSGWDTAQ